MAREPPRERIQYDGPTISGTPNKGRINQNTTRMTTMVITMMMPDFAQGCMGIDASLGI